MSKTHQQLYEFGAFRLDAVERQLLRGDEVVPLTPKAFDVLLALVEQAGHLLEKETLLKTVWPDSFVEENNLADNIFKLRKALGDGANGRRYIETVPRRGYRFVAEVREWGEEPAESAAVVAPGEQTAAPLKSQSQGRRQTVNKKPLVWLLACAGALAVSVAVWFYLQRQPTLTAKDTLLLADFENKTGEEIFDGVLKQGLATQLQQSPFLSVFPEARVQQTLRLMRHPPGAPVTVQVARELSERQNLKAFITGSIVPLGSHYVITLVAASGQTGDELARAQAEATSREQVLRALAQAAVRLREQLGESLSSIRKFDQPLYDLLQRETTTRDLAAFKAYSMGIECSWSGRFREAIPFYERAVELDPDFAHAYVQLALMYSLTDRPLRAEQYIKRAYQLRSQVGEFEQLRISVWYHALVTGNLNKQIETLLLLKQTYPRDWTAPNDLGYAYTQLGQFEQAIAEARESMRLNPIFGPAHRQLGRALLRLNRFSEAGEALSQAVSQNIHHDDIHRKLFELASINGDAAGIKEQLDWASRKPEGYLALDWQTSAAAYAGQWRKARELARRAIEMTARGETMEVAAQYAAEQALRGAVFGDCRQAGLDAAQGLKLARGRLPLTRAALALALCGATAQAQSLADELSGRYPEDTIINSIWLPAIRAGVELRRGNAEQAIERLQTTTRYEAAAEFWPQYLRGQAYLQLKQSVAAAEEFQKILDHRGHAPLSPLYPLAHLGLARAAALTGDTAKSQKAYEDFFAGWRGADADLPILSEARRGREKS